MKKEKENNKKKLDIIKTDLEIKLVKMQLEKLKFKEEKLPKKNNKNLNFIDMDLNEIATPIKPVEVKDESIIFDIETYNITSKKVDPKEKKENNKVVKKSDSFKSKKPADIKTKPKPKPAVLVKKVNVNKDESKPITKPKKQDVSKKSGVGVSKTKIVDKTKIGEIKNLTNKAPVKLINQNTVKEKQFKKPLIVKKEKKKNKSLILVASLFTILFLLGLGYVYNLKNQIKAKDTQLKEKIKENIDYNDSGYFKDVEDEVDEKDVQNFDSINNNETNTIKDNNLIKNKKNKKKANSSSKKKT